MDSQNANGVAPTPEQPKVEVEVMPQAVTIPSTPAATQTQTVISTNQTTVYAGFWRRLIAYLIDGLILNAVGWVLGLVIGVNIYARGTGTKSDAYGVLGFLLGWLYFALMESSSHQATLGKLALGLKVTDMEGKRISFGRASGRWFSKIISAVIILIGFIMAGLTEKKQALHDMIASTLVVKR